MKICSQTQAEWFRRRKWRLMVGPLIGVLAWVFFTTFAPVREYALWRFGPALPTVTPAWR